MGILDGIREIFGVRAEADASRGADPEDLFGMSTAYVTMAADLGFESVEEAALCFSEMDSTDFAEAKRDVRDILEAAREETDTEAHFRTDGHGYSWVVLRDDDFEDLVNSVHFAADTFVEAGYGSRLLAAVFGFERADGSRAYWIYSFRRGAYYPFAPAMGRERDSALEFKLESVLDGELDVEEDESYWYPLWPDEDGGHPWS